jgi:hypothetical protein
MHRSASIYGPYSLNDATRSIHGQAEQHAEDDLNDETKEKHHEVERTIALEGFVRWAEPTNIGCRRENENVEQ